MRPPFCWGNCKADKKKSGDRITYTPIEEDRNWIKVANTSKGKVLRMEHTSFKNMDQSEVDTIKQSAAACLPKIIKELNKPDFCWRSPSFECTGVYETCGPLACSKPGRCWTSVLEMAVGTLVAINEAVAFVGTLGTINTIRKAAKGAVKVAIKAAAKKDLKGKMFNTLKAKVRGYRVSQIHKTIKGFLNDYASQLQALGDDKNKLEMGCQMAIWSLKYDADLNSLGPEANVNEDAFVDNEKESGVCRGFMGCLNMVTGYLQWIDPTGLSKLVATFSHPLCSSLKKRKLMKMFRRRIR